MGETDVAILKESIHNLHEAFLCDTLNDCSMFNRFSILKTAKKGIKYLGMDYNRDSYKDLLDEVNGEFVRLICAASTVTHKEFIEECMTRTDMIDAGFIRREMSKKKVKRGSTGRGTKTIMKKIRRAG